MTTNLFGDAPKTTTNKRNFDFNNHSDDGDNYDSCYNSTRPVTLSKEHKGGLLYWKIRV
jgi:hypothetical protein